MAHKINSGSLYEVLDHNIKNYATTICSEYNQKEKLFFKVLKEEHNRYEYCFLNKKLQPLHFIQSNYQYFAKTSIWCIDLCEKSYKLFKPIISDTCFYSALLSIIKKFKNG